MKNRQILFDHPLFGEKLPQYRYYPWSEEDLSINQYFTTRYELLSRKENIPKNYDKNLTFENFPPEYLLIKEKINGEKLVGKEEIPFLFVYGNYHWNNILGLLFTLLNTCNSYDKDFSDLARRYSLPKEDLIIFWEDIDDYSESNVYCVFSKFMKIVRKDPCSYMSRYLYNYKEEIVLNGGLKIMMPSFYKIVNDISPKTFNGINDIFLRNLNELEYTEKDDNIKVFNIDYSKNYNKVYRYIPLKSEVTRIHAFRLTRDYSSDYSKTRKHKFPFGPNLLEYDPPISRSSEILKQPYKYVYVNGVKENSDLDIRITATEYMLTSMLDWCDLNNKEIPALGSEFYIHLGDKLPKSISDSNMKIACYSCEKKYLDNFSLFPDYTFQWVNGKIWENSKNIDEIENATEDGIYFEGDSYSKHNIRTDFAFLQDKNIKKSQQLNGVLDIRLSEPYENTKRNVYLYLPGAVSFNPMLKFRILENEHTLIIKDQDYTENYFENRLRKFDFNYINVKYPEEKDELIKKIGKFYQERNNDINTKRSLNLKERIKSISIESVLEDVYNIVINQNSYYGFK